MKKTNALKLRQNLGSILKSLEKDGLPILVERNSKPAAVLITLDDFKKRFVDRDADDKRKDIVNKIKASLLDLGEYQSTDDLIKQVRGE